jgi:hypothetical protein
MKIGFFEEIRDSLKINKKLIATSSDNIYLN